MLIAEFSHKGEEIEIENELWQYDYGQRIQIKGLDLPETFEVHFAWKDSEKAKVVIGSTVNGISTVDIPNVALEQRRTITAYIYLSDTTEGETVNTIVLSVNKRKAPENFETPEDVNLFHHTLAAAAEYQRQAKESEKQAAARSADAEAWTHGREDHPEQAQDNAKYYAEQAAKSAAEVPGKTEQAQKDIERTRQQAINAIASRQEAATSAVKSETENYINEKKTEAKNEITAHTDSEIERENEATAEMKDQLTQTISAAKTADEALKKTVGDAGNVQSEIGKSVQAAVAATVASEKQTGLAKTATEEAKKQAAAAKAATEALKTQTDHITFQINPEDGGLDVIYTE